MFKLRNILFLLISILSICSCSSKKNIIYLQDFHGSEISTVDYKTHQIKEGDILKISLLTNNPESLISFDQEKFVGSENRESLSFKSYTVDNNGNINYPEIGEIFVKTLTTFDLADLITNKLEELDILIVPVIDVKILNLNFTILGEVNSPGKYFYDDQNLNIFKAIGMAGDLTINGLRTSVKLIRTKNGKKYINNLDLTKTDIITSEFFQIQSDDILIVDPNTSKVKTAGIIGNSGTLLSLLSFILSLIIVVSNR